MSTKAEYGGISSHLSNGFRSKCCNIVPLPTTDTMGIGVSTENMWVMIKNSLQRLAEMDALNP